MLRHTPCRVRVCGKLRNLYQTARLHEKSINKNLDNASDGMNRCPWLGEGEQGCVAEVPLPM
jgi:hypothetical protein